MAIGAVHLRQYRNILNLPFFTLLTEWKRVNAIRLSARELIAKRLEVIVLCRFAGKSTVICQEAVSMIQILRRAMGGAYHVVCGVH